MPFNSADFKYKDIPYGVRMVAWGRMLRWVGWGFGEALLPIFLASFSATLTETGLLRSTYEIVFLLMVPLTGLMAESVPAKLLLMIGLLLYPFVGLSYYLAGATGIAVFLVMARVFNGVAYAFDSMGTDTYLRRVSEGSTAASMFGFLESFSTAGWLCAVIVSFFLVQYVPVHVLLAAIAPAALLAFFPYSRMPAAAPPAPRRAISFLNPYREFVREIVCWDRRLWRVAFIVFFSEVIYIIGTFFLPIAAYKQGASLQNVVFMTIIFNIPYVYSFQFARMIDRSDRGRVLRVSLILLPLCFFAVAAFPVFSVEVLAALGIEVITLILSLVAQSYITTLSARDHFGRVSGAMESVYIIGSLLGPIVIGLIADAFGFSGMFGIAAAISMLVVFYFILKRV